MAYLKRTPEIERKTPAYGCCIAVKRNPRGINAPNVGQDFSVQVSLAVEPVPPEEGTQTHIGGQVATVFGKETPGSNSSSNRRSNLLA